MRVYWIRDGSMIHEYAWGLINKLRSALVTSHLRDFQDLGFTLNNQIIVMDEVRKR